MCLHSSLSMTMTLVTVKPGIIFPQIDRGPSFSGKPKQDQEQIHRASCRSPPSQPLLLAVCRSVGALSHGQGEGAGFLMHVQASHLPQAGDVRSLWTLRCLQPAGVPFRDNYIHGRSCRPLLRPLLVCESVATTLMNEATAPGFVIHIPHDLALKFRYKI